MSSSVLDLKRRIRELELENTDLREENARLREAQSESKGVCSTRASSAKQTRGSCNQGEGRQLGDRAEAKGDDSRQCDNCDKFVPDANFDNHHMHCVRQFGRCEHCNDVVSVRGREEHAAEARGDAAGFMAAAADGDRALLARMLQHGQDIDVRGELRSETALHVAARESDRRLVAWLLDNGADANALDSHGQTALHICASQKESLKAAHVLLQRGADPAIRSALEDSAFDLAQRVGNSDFLLLGAQKARSRPNSAESSPSSSSSPSCGLSPSTPPEKPPLGRTSGRRRSSSGPRS